MMEGKRQKVVRDLILGFVMLLIGVVVYLRSLHIRASAYESLGAAFLPKLLSIGISAIAFIILVKALFDLRQVPRPRVATAAQPKESRPDDRPTFRRHPWVSAFFLAALVVYVGIMQFQVLSYRPATALFILCTSVLVMFFEPGHVSVVRVAVAVAVALALALGLFYIFTTMFSVGLS